MSVCEVADRVEVEANGTLECDAAAGCQQAEGRVGHVQAPDRT